MSVTSVTPWGSARRRSDSRRPFSSALSVMAAAEIGHFRMLEQHLEGLGVAVEDAMRPFVAQWDAYHASTAPRR